MKKILLLVALATSLFSFEWLPYDKALSLSKKNCKPVFLVIYKSGCPACNELFSELNESNLLKLMLVDYYMVKLSAIEASTKYGTSVASTPTMYLIDGDKSELMNPVPGLPADNEEFSNWLQYGVITFETLGCKVK